MAKRAREQAVKEKRDRKRERKAEAAMQQPEPTETDADGIDAPEAEQLDVPDAAPQPE